MPKTGPVQFFATPAEFHAWLEQHHEQAAELWVGFYKRSSGKASITWPESVDAALCFGWIDGVRKSLDAESYTIRFTPRKPTGKWSDINTRRVADLQQLGMMRDAGLRAFTKRVEARAGVYSYEQKQLVALSQEQEKAFRRNSKAWKFFQNQAHWYRKTAIWWIVSAKRQETQSKRLAELISCSEKGTHIPPLTRTKK